MRVAADSPWFDGHFEGAPVLPGVAHLQLGAVCGALDLARLNAVHAARMRTPLLPGESVDVEWQRAAGASSGSLRLARAGRPVSAFTLGFDADSAATTPAPIPAPTTPAARSDVAPLLPHSRAALLLAHVESADARALLGTIRVPARHAFAADGRASTALSLEIAAQAAAAHGVLGLRPEGASRGRGPRGYLVGARDVHLARRDFACDRDLAAIVAAAGAAPPLRIYRFELVQDGAPVAAGEISVFVESD